MKTVLCITHFVCSELWNTLLTGEEVITRITAMAQLAFVVSHAEFLGLVIIRRVISHSIQVRGNIGIEMTAHKRAVGGTVFRVGIVSPWHCLEDMQQSRHNKRARHELAMLFGKRFRRNVRTGNRDIYHFIFDITLSHYHITSTYPFQSVERTRARNFASA
jgi:hypothetical protein